MDKWFKDILPDKDPYHNLGRDQMRKKGGPEFECLWYNYMKITIFTLIGMIRLIGFNIHDIQIHVNIQLCNQ